MKKMSLIFLLLSVFHFSCGSVVNNIFRERTPHERYAEKIDDTPEGRAWVLASRQALQHQVPISLPYRHAGQFPADRPRALALAFAARQGERVSISFPGKEPGKDFVLYADIFRQESTATIHEYSAETSDSIFDFEVAKSGTYVLRLQPEMKSEVRYALTISAGPTLGFPVAGTKARTGSFWGAPRDGGRRSHEGIDIFAAKGTPVVAAADGYISSVRTGGKGGRTVWLRDRDRNISLYYAHLDKQLVSAGQFVKKGDTLGLVGNTGNARNTPAHLHFGIYTPGGATDPFPFVQRSEKKIPELPDIKQDGPIKAAKRFKTPGGVTVLPDTRLLPLAVYKGGYIAELPDGTITSAGFPASSGVK